jgi:hypothetical protein
MGSELPGHRLAASIPWNRFLGSIKVLKIPPLFVLDNLLWIEAKKKRIYSYLKYWRYKEKWVIRSYTIKGTKTNQSICSSTMKEGRQYLFSTIEGTKAKRSICSSTIEGTKMKRSICSSTILGTKMKRSNRSSTIDDLTLLQIISRPHSGTIYIEKAVLNLVPTHKLLLYEQFSTYINYLYTILKKFQDSENSLWTKIWPCMTDLCSFL